MKAILAALFFFSAAAARAEPTVIAPNFGAQFYCSAAVKSGQPPEHAADYCLSQGMNAADRIGKALDELGPVRSPSGRFELGYTLELSLFRFYVHTPNGWILDYGALNTALSTVRDLNRPVVLRLNATHFTAEGLDFAAELARDPRNLMWTKDGPMKSESYFYVPLHAWTLVDQQAPVNVYRHQAFQAVLDGICALPASARERIAAVAIIGETHQMFAGLAQQGAGYSSGFDITDYSPAAISGFHQWLQTRYRTIQRLNAAVGSSYPDFNAVQPPSKDLRTQAGAARWQHLDAYAAGHVPVFGWAKDMQNRPFKIAVYVDGKLQGETLADQNRTDVLTVRPEFGTPNVGFRYDIDYRALPAGVHTVDVVAVRPGETPMSIASRPLVVLDEPGQSPPNLGADSIATQPMQEGFLAYADSPAPSLAVLYNPLAALWTEYRNQVVRSFLESFGMQARKSCVPADKIFSHQIIPAMFPDWDPDLEAADASLRPSPYYNPGVTMYGGATFGDQFFRYKTAMGWKSYGVGEMHPLTKLTPEEYRRMFERHHDAGARYLAPYFMTLFFQGGSNDLANTRIAPDNPQRGSNDFYKGISDLMRND